MQEQKGKLIRHPLCYTILGLSERDANKVLDLQVLRCLGKRTAWSLDVGLGGRASARESRSGVSVLRKGKTEAGGWLPLQVLAALQ